MAVTRKSLKAMGLTDEQVDSIVEMHTETVEGLKADIAKYKADAEKLSEVQRELTTAQEELSTAKNDGWKEKHDKVKKEFDDYKADITAKEVKAAKEKAVRAYFEGKNIEGANLNLAMRSTVAEIEALELDGDKIKDTSVLDALVNGDLQGLVTKTTVQGAKIANPPINEPGKFTRADVYKRDDHGRYVYSASERQKMLAENPELLK